MAKMLTIPQVIRAALERGAALAVNISGGKDSQAMLAALSQAHRAHGWPGPILAIHADLGRAEWPQTAGQVSAQAHAAGLSLAVVAREQGDLVARIDARSAQLAGTGKPAWPSSAARYCTSDLKRAPIDKHLRQYPLVISAEGIRRDESPARAKNPRVEVRKRITAQALRNLAPDAALAAWTPETGRLALTWRPIIDWAEADVWAGLGASQAEIDARRHHYKGLRRELTAAGMVPAEARKAASATALGPLVAWPRPWPGHPAYVWGNQRLSCVFCIFANKNDLQNGADWNPDLWAAYVAMEAGAGTFKQDLSLAEIVPDGWPGPN